METKDRYITAGVLIAVWVFAVLNWTWPWGVLFLAWALSSLRTKQTFLIREIDKGQNPMLYWAVLSTWIIMGVLIILGEYQPGLAGATF